MLSLQLRRKYYTVVRNSRNRRYGTLYLRKLCGSCTFKRRLHINIHSRCTLNRTGKMFLIFLNRKGDILYHTSWFLISNFRPILVFIILFFGWFLGVCTLYADVSEYTVNFIFTGGVSRKMEQNSETSAYKIQTPGNQPIRKDMTS